MKKRFLLFLLLTSQLSNACINGRGFNIFGQLTSYDMPLFQVRKLTSTDYIEEIKKQETELKKYSEEKKNSWDYSNEMAILNIYKGEYAEAKKFLYLAIKQDKLNYSICSNLGVVYELTGNIDSAYYYTKKAVYLNPQSHKESEWIHIKVLEAYKKMQQDPKWIYNYSVLGFKIDLNELPKKKYGIGMDTAHGHYYVQELISQIEWQLRERMVFVKPKNQIVANLLFTLGELYITEIDCQKAEEVYKLAMEYDPELTEICNKRINGVLYHLNPFAKQAKQARENVKAAFEKRDTALAKLSGLKMNQIQTHLELTLASIQLQKAQTKKYSILGVCCIIIILIVWLFFRKRKNV